MTLQQEYREKYNEGLEAGIEQGMERGIEQGKIEILYVDLHLTIAEIAQKLGLSEEYIKRIVDEIEAKS